MVLALRGTANEHQQPLIAEREDDPELGVENDHSSSELEDIEPIANEFGEEPLAPLPPRADDANRSDDRGLVSGSDGEEEPAVVQVYRPPSDGGSDSMVLTQPLVDGSVPGP
jgi:hypothetical protein